MSSVPLDDLVVIAERYIRRPRIRGDLRTHAGATGKCSIVSSDLVDDYCAAGFEACRIRFRGHRTDVPNPHPEGDTREEHLAVLVEGVVIDATRRQFDPSADVPTVYETVEAAGRDWCEIYEDEFSRITRALPPP